MKQGDKIKCPHCGELTFLKSKNILDGWTVKEKILVCALCGKEICKDLPDDRTHADDASGNQALHSLENLFGTGPVEHVRLTADESEQRFCKDCSFVIRHPFRLCCSKTGKDVEPMADCPDFKKILPKP